MNREQLVADIRSTLLKTGFYLSNKNIIPNLIFDIIARRDNTLLVIKVLINIDAFKRVTAEQLMVFSHTLNGVPILIGVRSGSGKLMDGIVYSRFSVPIISKGTLEDFLIEGLSPIALAGPGGIYMNFDQERLTKLRTERHMSLGEIADVAGVSRKAIQMYEGGMCTTIDVALELEKFFGENIIQPIDIFTRNTPPPPITTIPENVDAFYKHIFYNLLRLGYEVLPLIKCPIDALTKNNKLLFLTGIEKDITHLREKALIVADISKVTEKQSVLFTEKFGRNNIEGTPIVDRNELNDIKDHEVVLELIFERRSSRN